MSIAASWSGLARSVLSPAMLAQTRQRLAHRMRSDSIAYGFRRDLAMASPPPRAKIELTLRPIREADAAELLAAGEASLTPAEAWERISRRRLLDAGFGRCYVAANPKGVPCYMQWLFLPGDNDRVAAYFHGAFPRLAADEALLEGAYTPPAFRGYGVMPASMFLLAAEGARHGARRVVTFVAADNVASMKGCVRAGFPPYVMRKDSWRLLRRHTAFVPLPADFHETYKPIFS